MKPMSLVQRRDFLRLGNLVLGGGMLFPGMSASQERRRARACIVLFQVGGPYQCDTFDPKPLASEEIRGPFRPIATPVPGLHLTSALPRVARHADKFAILRSVHHTIRCHNPAIYCSLVGREATAPLAVSNQTAARRTDHPHYASALARLQPGSGVMPSHVIVPDVTFNGPAKTPGLMAGYLGANYDPFIVGQDPGAASFQVEAVGLPADVDAVRLEDRRTLIARLEAGQRRAETSGALDNMSTFYRRAFSLLTSPRTKQAFDLGREPARVRERYGRHTIGQSTLLARRLVEAGVPFVSVFSHTVVERGSWDTHQDHYETITNNHLPGADQTLSALLEDMHERGLLDDVLVVWMGEFGRTPRMGIQFSNAGNNARGRDHWCNCYSVVLAGGGVRGGRVIGSSDSQGAYPRERPIHISDLAATLFACFGLDPRTEYRDIQGQQRYLCDGNVVEELF